jgi:hypothetical protein
MRVVTVSESPGSRSHDYRQDLEAGDILFFPATPFPLSEETKQGFRTLQLAGNTLHKNVAYRPAENRVTGYKGANLSPETLQKLFKTYSDAVIRFTADLLPDYAKAWRLDYASFRPVEEEGRSLPLTKRNDLLHTDAFPSRPTFGGLILRVFTNIHPTKTRVWITADPFPEIAATYAKQAGLDRIAELVRTMRMAGLPVVPRSPYDRFMLGFHDYLKRNTEFQGGCRKYRFEFPPGSTWMVFTDVVPHSVESGQHALEQTFIVSQNSLANPQNAPVAVLERLSGRVLTGNAA